MTSARDFFGNHLQTLGYTQKYAAELIGCSGGTITNYIDYRRELKFPTVMNAKDSLFDGDEHFVKLFCAESRNSQNIKYSLEYLSTNRCFDEIESLINRCERENKLLDWCKVYRLIINFQLMTDSYKSILQRIYILSHEIKDVELKVLLDIIEANVHHNIYESSIVTRLIETIEEKLAEVPDSYFKSSLNIRVLELRSIDSLFSRNDPKTARSYAKQVISSKIGTKFVADSYNIIGTSYIFEDANKSLKYMSKSIKILRKIGCQEVADIREGGTKRFIQTYWGLNLTEGNGTTQESELAFMAAKRGETDKALEMLDELEETPFRIYYEGVAKNDPMIHFKALGKFIELNEMFYAQLPYRELLKHEQFKEAVKSLLNQN
ncbi:AimR family lysis-lysogeny pheromone receptor [Thalassobacillus sp. CUG 92003]|uniref:AimR family lysis-lysogeny pheromone receptor n=1 Tax=Thalassobacillus sp. CUG 92003 TaxID=2736641 RepID=UPI0015E70D9D|nr:AimR family lysis-lysogeny pheromone receptor [Thalassobacillus sp. CUG 92003]